MSEQEREIILDIGPCNACTGCVELCPEIFGWDENAGRPYLKRSTASPEEVQDIVATCPGDCIAVSD